MELEQDRRTSGRGLSKTTPWMTCCRTMVTIMMDAHFAVHWERISSQLDRKMVLMEKRLANSAIQRVSFFPFLFAFFLS